nr:MAG TPA: hypothetical protein [Caudoviricetes sp.]
MKMEEMKERAKFILRDYEERKKRLADRISISYLQSLETLTSEELDEWKAKELYAIDLNNEAETAFYTITNLGVMSIEEALEYEDEVKAELKLPDEGEESDEPG